MVECAFVPAEMPLAHTRPVACFSSGEACQGRSARHVILEDVAVIVCEEVRFIRLVRPRRSSRGYRRGGCGRRGCGAGRRGRGWRRRVLQVLMDENIGGLVCVVVGHVGVVLLPVEILAI